MSRPAKYAVACMAAEDKALAPEERDATRRASRPGECRNSRDRSGRLPLWGLNLYKVIPAKFHVEAIHA